MATLFYTSCAEMVSILAQACLVVVCVAQRQFSPIAKPAVGHLLDELKNDITLETPAQLTSRALITSSPRFRALPSRCLLTATIHSQHNTVKPYSSNCSSAVNTVRSFNFAVAMIKRSQGSSWTRGSSAAAMQTFNSNGSTVRP